MAGLRYILVLTLVFGFLSTPARAQEETACIPEAMAAIESAGLLEAQREITQNQNIIAKPDSVLEYSCYEQHATLSGAVTGALFTEFESYFDITDPFIDQYSLDRGIYYLVFTALVDYLRNNYWHRYLGDRSNLEALPEPDPDALFTCYAMAYVWDRARCTNFTEGREAEDFFYSFDEYQGIADPRNLPDPRVCEAWPGWEGEIANMQALNVPNDVPVTMTPILDPIVVYPALFEPGNCGDPIPTGLWLPPARGATGAAVTKPGNYAEFTCSNPGCTWNGSTCE